MNWYLFGWAVTCVLCLVALYYCDCNRGWPKWLAQDEPTVTPVLRPTVGDNNISLSIPVGGEFSLIITRGQFNLSKWEGDTTVEAEGDGQVCGGDCSCCTSCGDCGTSGTSGTSGSTCSTMPEVIAPPPLAPPAEGEKDECKVIQRNPLGMIRPAGETGPKGMASSESHVHAAHHTPRRSEERMIVRCLRDLETVVGVVTHTDYGPKSVGESFPIFVDDYEADGADYEVVHARI